VGIITGRSNTLRIERKIIRKARKKWDENTRRRNERIPRSGIVSRGFM